MVEQRESTKRARGLRTSKGDCCLGAYDQFFPHLRQSSSTRRDVDAIAACGPQIQIALDTQRFYNSLIRMTRERIQETTGMELG